jgi:hypothetical protein
MEIFRFREDVYGQKAIEGLNWNLIWIFLGIAAAVILVHLLISAFRGKTRN